MLPRLIQGGMGVGVSGWELARKVSMHGQLGVVSGTALDTILVRRLGKGDFGAHNLFIGLAFERGLPALFIFLFLMGRFFTTTWRRLRSDQTQLTDKGLSTGVFASGVAFLVVGMGSSMLDIENIRALFWVLLAIAFVPADENKKEIE